MASYPNGKFINEFARRTLVNLECMKSNKPIRWGDTALISFLLGVFVLPHERADQDDFMSDVLKNYPGKISDVVEILRQKKVRSDSKNNDHKLPQNIDELPKYLRHAISHFNLKPQSDDDQNLTHILVWNRQPWGNKDIDFVAKINIERLRELAEYVLRSFHDKSISDRYENINPEAEYDKQKD